MKTKTSGMTLIELLVVIAVVAILAAVAAPNFNDTIKRNRVQSQIRELVGMLATARSEAVSRSRRVTVCASSDGASCVGNWNQGWLMFVDGGTEGIKEVADEIIKIHDGLGDNTMKVTDNTNITPAARTWVSFSRSGFSDQRITWAICDKDADEVFARAILMENTGSAVLSSANANNVHEDIRGNELTCP